MGTNDSCLMGSYPSWLLVYIKSLYRWSNKWNIEVAFRNAHGNQSSRNFVNFDKDKAWIQMMAKSVDEKDDAACRVPYLMILETLFD